MYWYSYCNHSGLSSSSALSEVKMPFQSWCLCQYCQRDSLSAKETIDLCPSERRFWWTFNFSLLSGFTTEPLQEANCPLLMLYRKGLCSPPLGGDTRVHRLRGCSLSSSISDRKASLQPKTKEPHGRWNGSTLPRIPCLGRFPLFPVCDCYWVGGYNYKVLERVWLALYPN